MALPGRCAGPSRLVLERPRVCRSLLGGESCAKVATQISSIFQVARRTGAAAMPARHACADALASSAVPGSGARQTARRRCGRRSARPARDCRCPRADARPSPGRRRPVEPSITRCGRRGGDASEARMCRCAGEQRRAGIGRTADRATPMRTQVRKASKGLPVPARRGLPRTGPTTARRCVDHALRQARRRCQRGTYVPTRWRAAPRRDRAHGRPR